MCLVLCVVHVHMGTSRERMPRYTGLSPDDYTVLLLRNCERKHKCISPRLSAPSHARTHVHAHKHIQDRMHLDCVFSILSDTCCIMLETIMGDASPMRRLVDEYAKDSATGKYTLQRCVDECEEWSLWMGSACSWPRPLLRQFADAYVVAIIWCVAVSATPCTASGGPS
jgi:hypothetical protein